MPDDAEYIGLIVDAEGEFRVASDAWPGILAALRTARTAPTLLILPSWQDENAPIAVWSDRVIAAFLITTTYLDAERKRRAAERLTDPDSD